jgi:hypothetical protein
MTPKKIDLRLNPEDVPPHKEFYASFLSLSKLLGQPIKDILGYVSTDLSGDPQFKLCFIILVDGSEIGVEGEHDFPYVYSDEESHNLSEETLQEIYDEDEDE